MGSYVIRQQPELPNSASNVSIMSILESSSSINSGSSIGSSSSNPAKNIMPENTNACIVMELMSRGSMADLFAKERVIVNCVTRYNN